MNASNLTIPCLVSFITTYIILKKPNHFQSHFLDQNCVKKERKEVASKEEEKICLLTFTRSLSNKKVTF
jgi:hypothetical protein